MHFWQDYLSTYNCLILLLLTPFLKTNKAFNPLIFYIWIYGSIKSQFPLPSLEFPGIGLSLDRDANFVLLLTAAFTSLLKTKINKKTIETLLGYTCFINLLITVITTPTMDTFVSGIVPNKAMNAIFNLILFPFTTVLPTPFAVFSIIVIVPLTILSKSSSAFGAMVAMIFVYCFYYFRKRAILPVLIALVGGGYFLIPKLFDDARRFQLYEFFFAFMPHKWAFGHGPGSFSTLGIVYQDRFKFLVEEGYTLFMHSDWLQFVWEYGLLGLVPLTWLLWNIVKYGGKTIVVVTATVIAGSAFYYPFHFPVHLIAILMILKLFAINYETQNQINHR